MWNRSTAVAKVSSLVGLLLVAAGCSGGAGGAQLDVYPASGTITVDGAPRAGVSVVYSPEPDTAGNGGYGVTDAQGNYTMKSHDGRDGVPAGIYRVVLIYMALPDGSPVPSGASAADLGAENLIEEIYSDPSQSPAVVEVAKGSSEPFTLDVKLKKKK